MHPSHIPDTRHQPLGQATAATTAVLRRITGKRQQQVPVAAFQSSI